jgi:hypothetical protein
VVPFLGVGLEDGHQLHRGDAEIDQVWDLLHKSPAYVPRLRSAMPEEGSLVNSRTWSS